MFVPGKPFQPSLTFASKARSLPKSVSLERCFSEKEKKSFIGLTPGREADTTAVVAAADANVIKLFSSSLTQRTNKLQCLALRG